MDDCNQLVYTETSQRCDFEFDDTHGVYELKLTDGTKILKEFGWSSIDSIVERVSDAGTRKGGKFTSLRFKDGSTVEVACNLRMLMKLLKKEYHSWSESIMGESVKNGTKID